MFTIAINATGIDPEKDRLIDIACKCLDSDKVFYQTVNPDMLLSTSIMQTSGLSMKKIADSDNCKKVLNDLLIWINNEANGKEKTILTSINGHRFVFPLLTKELRRSKTKITFPIILFDASLILKQKSLTDGSAYEKLLNLEKQFEQQTACSLQSKRGLYLLENSNIQFMKQNPQPTFQTRNFSVNKHL